jgi:hypothetical protein
MNKILVFLLAFSLSLIDANALIIATPNLQLFEKALQRVDQQTLVLFDVDDTLIVSKDRILRCTVREFFNQYKHEAWKRYGFPPEKEELFLSQIFAKMEFELLDPKIVKLIHALQKQNIKTIAFTRMNTGAFGIIPNMQDWRLQQLKNFRIDFSPAFPEYKEIRIEAELTGNKPSSFKQGLLCANRQDKGPVLAAFLKKIEWKPARVFFIDDRLDYLESVEASLQNSGIEFFGFHYTEKENHPIIIDEEVAKFQVMHLTKTGIWLSETEASQSISNQ